ncbi:MAG: RDD family protein [Planctomycetota bacterium]
MLSESTVLPRILHRYSLQLTGFDESKNMPIKVRCEGCQTVLNVSDQAAGKAVKCKHCGGRVVVPAPEEGIAPRKKARPGRPEEDPDDPFSSIDLRSMEDTKKKICPGCARPVRDEDIECPKCGVNIATGALSERQRIRLERKGPPPEEFYASVWSNAWKFLKKHWTYGVKTAVVWSMCLAMSATCSLALRYYVVNRVKFLNEEVQRLGAAVKPHPGNPAMFILETPKEKGSVMMYDNTAYTQLNRKIPLWKPEFQAWKEPPSLFWIGMATVFQLGFGGWSWTLATIIAGVTMAGEKKIKRFQFDFFANLTMGFRFYAWPVILCLPLLVIPGVLAAWNPLVGGILAAVMLIIPILVLPAAVVHMAQKYTHRAWLLTWMLKDFGRTIGASLYVFAMNLFLVLPVPIALGVVGGLLQNRIATSLQSTEVNILEWLKANVMDMGEGNFRFLMYQMPLYFGSAFLFFFMTSVLVAFPAVFMMRVIGLYGVYFRADLSIVNEFPDFEPVGFGPRYLAYLVDNLIMVLLALVGFFVGSLFGGLFNWYGWSIADQLGLGVSALATLGLWGFYFASGESGAARATLGKWSLGMIALKEDNKVMTRKEAFGRAAAAFVTVLTCYIGFVICFFRADRKAMHDLMTKTKVVWQSETT